MDISTLAKVGSDTFEPRVANDNMRLLRLNEVLKLIPMSRSTFYAGIKAGIYPAPIKLGARISAWKTSEILPLLERGTQR